MGLFALAESKDARALAQAAHNNLGLFLEHNTKGEAASLRYLYLLMFARGFINDAIEKLEAQRNGTGSNGKED